MSKFKRGEIVECFHCNSWRMAIIQSDEREGQVKIIMHGCLTPTGVVSDESDIIIVKDFSKLRYIKPSVYIPTKTGEQHAEV